MTIQRDETNHIADELAADGVDGPPQQQPGPALLAPPADDQVLLAAFEAEIATGAAPVSLCLDWPVAWALLATIQLACRQPQFPPATLAIAKEIGGKLADRLTLGPATKAIAERGWTEPRTTATKDTTGKWLIWSNERRAWWADKNSGYTTFQQNAGRYSFEEASAIARDANRYLRDQEGSQPNESICPDWNPETAVA